MKDLLIIDDDKIFAEVLARSLGKLGFEARIAHDSVNAIAIMKAFSPEYILLDLKMQNETGLQLIPKLLEVEPYSKIVVLTGFASVNTAVEAIKLGAVHYLSKPVEVEEIIAAFNKAEGNPETPVDETSLSLFQAEWRHIKTALDKNGGNISATARELKMHRRTLQRKIEKMS